METELAQTPEMEPEPERIPDLEINPEQAPKKEANEKAKAPASYSLKSIILIGAMFSVALATIITLILTLTSKGKLTRVKELIPKQVPQREDQSASLLTKVAFVVQSLPVATKAGIMVATLVVMLVILSMIVYLMFARNREKPLLPVVVKKESGWSIKHQFIGVIVIAIALTFVIIGAIYAAANADEDTTTDPVNPVQKPAVHAPRGVDDATWRKYHGVAFRARMLFTVGNPLYDRQMAGTEWSRFSEATLLELNTREQYSISQMNIALILQSSADKYLFFPNDDTTSLKSVFDLTQLAAHTHEVILQALDNSQPLNQLLDAISTEVNSTRVLVNSPQAGLPDNFAEWPAYLAAKYILVHSLVLSIVCPALVSPNKSNIKWKPLVIDNYTIQLNPIIRYTLEIYNVAFFTQHPTAQFMLVADGSRSRSTMKVIGVQPDDFRKIDKSGLEQIDNLLNSIRKFFKDFEEGKLSLEFDPEKPSQAYTDM